MKAFVVAAAWLVFAGCSSREAKEERAVIFALDSLRESPSDNLAQRRSLIDALEKLPATTPRAQSARDACVKSYRLILESKELTQKLKLELVNSGQAPKNALSDLALAEEKIKQSEPAMAACQKAALDLALARR